MMCRFWWGNQIDSRKIHWIKWEKLCWPKEAEGMGYRDLATFNLAMLAKQGWRLLLYPNSLLARILRARYFPSENFLHAQHGANPSFTWKSLLEGRKVLDLGILWRIGNGFSIIIWSDPWIPSLEGFKIQSAHKS